MFILMSGIADAESIEKSSVSDRIHFMMKTSGIAITITSITDFLAFSIGASSVFVSVRNFCIYTGKSIQKPKVWWHTSACNISHNEVQLSSLPPTCKINHAITCNNVNLRLN